MEEDQGSGTVQVLSVERGWIVVHFSSAYPASERRFHLLHQALLLWQSMNLHCRLQNIEPIRENGELRGLNVFYSLEPPPQVTLTIQVDTDLARHYSSEYLEAVIADVGTFLLSHSETPPTVAVVNRRHIAVVVNREKSTASVVHVEKIEPAMGVDHRQQLRGWLAQPTSQHFVTELPHGFRPNLAEGS